MHDETTLKIIAALQENARLQWKDIGSRVHLTGQAVAERVRRLEDQGLIEGYSARINPAKLGLTVTALITVFMTNTRHSEFQAFLRHRPGIAEAHRISGEGCYWLKAVLASPEELNALLNELLPFGNYRVNLSIDKIR
ncbi:MAG TPA: Lrp/AsnC family transcriptional regulator [Patescibacteria group bacterium]|nr:Lrp/AsnC family transcriptional regulator [Patescibacteria group bacterium]